MKKNAAAAIVLIFVLALCGCIESETTKGLQEKDKSSAPPAGGGVESDISIEAIVALWLQNKTGEAKDKCIGHFENTVSKPGGYELKIDINGKTEIICDSEGNPARTRREDASTITDLKT